MPPRLAFLPRQRRHELPPPVVASSCLPSPLLLAFSASTVSRAHCSPWRLWRWRWLWRRLPAHVLRIGLQAAEPVRPATTGRPLPQPLRLRYRPSSASSTAR
jgi:hypothetical protein